MSAAAAKPLISEIPIGEKGEIPSDFEFIINEIKDTLNSYGKYKYSSDAEKNKVFITIVKDLQHNLALNGLTKSKDDIIKYLSIPYFRSYNKADKKRAPVAFINRLGAERYKSKRDELYSLIERLGLLNYYEGGRRRYHKQTKRAHTRRHKKGRKHTRRQRLL